MSNEEFQKLVLERLESLGRGQKTLENGQKEINTKLDNLTVHVNIIEEQTKDLSEFRQGVKDKFKDISNL